MKVVTWIIYLAAWLVHGMVLVSCDLDGKTWQYWVLTIAMAIAILFLPNRWEV